MMFRIAAGKRLKHTMSSFTVSKAGGEMTGNHQGAPPPRAIALVLGFGGSKPRHVAKYAKLYTCKGCTTVSGTAPNYDIFVGPQSGLDEFALAAIQHVTKVLREDPTEQIPVVMHIISNGGAYVSRRISRMLRESNKCDETRKDDLKLFADHLRLGYQVFDSAPCYLSVKTAFSVIYHLIPNPVLAVPVATLFCIKSVIATYAVSILSRRPPEPQLFWNELLQDKVCMRQAFIYSGNDDIADATKIDEFIEERKERGVSVMSLHFEESEHVQHLRIHQAEYSEFIEKVLVDMEKRNSSQP